MDIEIILYFLFNFECQVKPCLLDKDHQQKLNCLSLTLRLESREPPVEDSDTLIVLVDLRVASPLVASWREIHQSGASELQPTAIMENTGSRACVRFHPRSPNSLLCIKIILCIPAGTGSRRLEHQLPPKSVA